MFNCLAVVFRIYKYAMLNSSIKSSIFNLDNITKKG